MNLGACTGPEHLQLRTSGSAGRSLPPPRGSESSLAPRGRLPPAQCPQEASQAGKLILSWDNSGLGGLPPRVSAPTQKGPKLPPAGAAALIHRSPRAGGNVSLPASAALLPTPLHQVRPERQAFEGQCTPCWLVLLAVRWLPSLLPRRLQPDGGPRWAIAINILPAMPSQKPPLDTAWPMGTVRQDSWASQTL